MPEQPARPARPDPPGRPGVLVLGMHRSGTSAATALVHRLGLHTCLAADRLDDPRGNAKGHFESISMVKVNDELLTEMGRNWWCPPRAGPAAAAEWSRVSYDPAAARRAFDEVHPEAPFVWKDPRTVLTLPLWRRALGPHLAAVAVLRNPLDVAASLAARSKLRLTHGVALWERYNRHLLANLAGMPAILTRYDDLVDNPLRWCAEVEAFLQRCGIACSPAPAGALSEFVDASLRHHSSTRAELLSSFGASAALYDAFEASLGAWSAFEPPELPEESPFVEAELTAVGSWQRDVVPKPAPPVVSVVVVAERNEAAEAASHLAPQLLPFMEAVLVVRAGPAAGGGDAGGLAALHPRLRVVTVEAGMTLGAARAAGAAAATAQILDFRVPFATTSQHWPPEVRRAIAAGYAAVTPALEGAGPGGGPAFGLAFKGPFCNLEWLGKPEDSLATVPLLAGACFA
ncbi:MAG TPA: hypothetical protein VMD59_21780, partial [Acidimicrobiales bacterium]|nr:hypothetical protein [Acidimicrobiales bacterium]